MIKNEINARRILHQVKTSVGLTVDSVVDIGLLVGNGNHLDIYVAVVVDVVPDKKIIFSNPFTGDIEEADLFINDYNHPEHRMEWCRGWIKKGKHVIFVMRSYEANGDFRCY